MLNPVTLPASAWLVLPTMGAMFLGYRVQDRLDQEVFRRVTLAVLVLSGLNLLRRALGRERARRGARGRGPPARPRR